MTFKYNDVVVHKETGELMLCLSDRSRYCYKQCMHSGRLINQKDPTIEVLSFTSWHHRKYLINLGPL